MERIDIPRAPGLGLMLEEIHYERSEHCQHNFRNIGATSKGFGSASSSCRSGSGSVLKRMSLRDPDADPDPMLDFLQCEDKKFAKIFTKKKFVNVYS